MAEQRDQRLELRLPRRRLTARVDPDRLERALVNLLVNAQRYGRKGGLIQLRVVERGALAEFRVADDGPGIPEADRERIFERYYRADTAASRRSQGSGLGLPIVRAIAELHRGHVWVEATPGGGATFVLDLRRNLQHVGLRNENLDH